jgi:hypothetical protein
MLHDSGFPIVAVPLMVVMMVGMGVMMWFMMKMMMGMGGHETHGPQRSEEHDTADEMNALRNEMASLRQELESMRTGSAGGGGTGSLPSEDPELQGRDHGIS